MQNKVDKSNTTPIKSESPLSNSKKNDVLGKPLTKSKLSKSLDTLKVLKEEDVTENGDLVSNHDDDDDNRSGINQHTKTRSSTASSTGNVATGIGGFRFTKKNNDSPGFLQALSHVKDFMTDIQKGHILLREAKLLMEVADYKTSIDVLNEG